MRISLANQIEKAPTGAKFLLVTDDSNGKIGFVLLSEVFAEHTLSTGILAQSISTADVNPLTGTEIGLGYANVTLPRPAENYYPAYIVGYLNGIMTSGLTFSLDTPSLSTDDFNATVFGLDDFADTGYRLELIVQWTLSI